MKANVVGDLLKDNILCFQRLVNADTPIVLDPVSISNLDGAGLQLITETSGSTHLTGTWLIEASNNYVSSAFPNFNQGAQVGTSKWSDVTGLFKGGAGAVVNPAGSNTNQFVQCYPLVALSLRVTFTPSGAATNPGLLTVLYCAKGNR